MNAALSQVLVVDDDADTRKLVSALLQQIGIQSLLVKDGHTALKLLCEGLMPGMIVLDLAMPVMDGYEVLEQIREDSRFNGVPVLILSATINPDTVQRALSLGADGYVTKGHMVQTLIDRVRVLLAAGRQRQVKAVNTANTVPVQVPDELFSNDAPSIEVPHRGETDR